MLKKSTLCRLLLIVVMLSACSPTAVSHNMPLVVCAPEAELTITSSKKQVSEFIPKNKNLISSFDEDECYNITPDFIADNSEYTIFKYDTSRESFIMYDGEVYSIGNCYGFDGITSMALADINMDNQYELYYTFTSGSGMPYSQIGYFDPVSKEDTIFDFVTHFSSLMLTMNESGDLCLNYATYPEGDSYVDFTIRSKEMIGTVIFDKGEITLNIDDSIIK